MTTEVIFEHQGPIGRITFSQPKGINIFSTSVLAALEARLDEVAKHPEIRVLILTGSGKTFVAGADISEMAAAARDTGNMFSRRGHAGMDKLANIEQVVTIAAINGPAFGGGCEMACACDLRVMANEAKIGVPEVKLGLIPGWGGTQRLRLLLGPGEARRLVFTGEPLDGQAALKIGLVNMAVPAAELMTAVNALANQILANGPTAVRMAKRALLAMDKMLLEKGLLAEAGAFGEAFKHPESSDGLKAFLEKRPPSWQKPCGCGCEKA
jgi:enoyl-CoA hydratase